jgi:hypothetical protein
MKTRTETTCANIHKQDCCFSFDGCGIKCIGYIRAPYTKMEPTLNESINLGEIPSKGNKK